MLDLKFSIRNPFNRKSDFKSLMERGGVLHGNKMWEIQFTHYTYNLLELEFNTHFSGNDHAGPSLSFGLFGLNALFKIYDRRHWDDATCAWE